MLPAEEVKVTGALRALKRGVETMVTSHEEMRMSILVAIGDGSKERRDMKPGRKRKANTKI